MPFNCVPRSLLVCCAWDGRGGSCCGVSGAGRMLTHSYSGFVQCVRDAHLIDHSILKAVFWMVLPCLISGEHECPSTEILRTFYRCSDGSLGHSAVIVPLAGVQVQSEVVNLVSILISADDLAHLANRRPPLIASPRVIDALAGCLVFICYICSWPCVSEVSAVKAQGPNTVVPSPH